MKKKLFFLIFIIYLIFPVFVNAEELKYEVCKSGCEYSDLQEVFTLVNDPNDRSSVPENAIYDVVIEIKDGETYNVDFRTIDSGYVTNTNAKTFTIKGSNSDNRPTIYSGDDEMSFWIKYGEYFLIENVIMKNLETDHSFHGGDLFLMANGKNDLVEIRNSEFYVQDCFDIWAYSITVKDSAFYADDGIGFDAYGGVNTLENVIVRPTEYFDFTGEGICNATNVDVEADHYEDGMYLSGDCQNTLDNINIRGAQNGIYVYASYSERPDSKYKGFSKKTIIKNSNLVDNDISIYASGNHNINDIDIEVENTKLKTVVSKGKKDVLDTLLGPTVLIKGSSIWASPITRSNDENSDATVKELLDGKVIIEEKKILDLNFDDKDTVIDVSSLFNNIDGVDFTTVNWRVSDQSILDIIDNKLIPKKTGLVTITGEYNNNLYEVQVKIFKNNPLIPIINPETGNHLLLVIFLIVSGFVYYKYVSRKTLQ